jgi:ribokinase
VLTRGVRGALVATGGAIVGRVSARRADAVDTTAAGDTFTGVLVARLAAGADLDSALHAAAVAASISVGRHGAAESMPTGAEIDAELTRTDDSGPAPMITPTAEPALQETP